MLKTSKRILKNNKPLLLFIALEIIALTLTFKEGIFHCKPLCYINSIANNVNKKIAEIENYPSIKLKNEHLLNDILILKSKLFNLQEKTNVAPTNQYELISAKVINNSFIHSKNYITLNKGTKDGIKPDMAVISGDSIVGKIKFVTKNYSTAMSLLHINNYVSIKFKNSNIIGTLKWDGKNYKKAEILYVPKCSNINVGDEVVTSSYNSIFPENIKVGTVSHIDKLDNELFLIIKISLTTDFSALDNVYVVKNIFHKEIKDLEQETKEFYE